MAKFPQIRLANTYGLVQPISGIFSDFGLLEYGSVVLVEAKFELIEYDVNRGLQSLRVFVVILMRVQIWS